LSAVTLAKIEKIIYIIRGQKVMLDSDLAALYEVETRIFNQSIRRNEKRFPKDFMFQLTKDEHESLRSQIEISKKVGHGGRRYEPFAFTEQGVAMLSSILNSENAILINISIMRTFVKIRKVLGADETLSDKLSDLEKGTDKLFRMVFERLDNLEEVTPVLPARRKKIGLREK
jgi:hypothetical protein